MQEAPPVKVIIPMSLRGRIPASNFLQRLHVSVPETAKASKMTERAAHLPVACETSKMTGTSSSSTSRDPLAVEYRMEACLRFTVFCVPVVVSCLGRDPVQ